MGIKFKSEKLSGRFPELWRGECKVLPGGFHPANTIADGTVVRTGALLSVDFDSMSAGVVKTALVVNGGTTTALRVAKGHYFTAGDSVAVANGAVIVTVKSVDSTTADYDIITFDKALTGVKADDVLIEAASELVNEKAAPRFVPNMIVSSDKEFKKTGINTLDAGYDAVVLIPSLAATPVLPEWIDGVFLKKNPNIIFIKQ